MFANRARLMEILRYLMAGGLNFLCTFTVFFTLIELIRVNYHFALAVTWVASLVFNYAIHTVWVFRIAKSVPPVGPIGKYFVVYAIAYLLNWSMVYGFVEIGGLSALLAQIIAMPCVIVFNYVVIKFVVLRSTNPWTRFFVKEDP